MSKIIALFFIFVLTFTLFSCEKSPDKETAPFKTAESETPEATHTEPSPVVTPFDNTYEQISQEKAKELMDSFPNAIILDVRTRQEYDMGHIENAILIPDYEISQRAEKELPDKDALILVYCRSGNRSKNASQILADMGYTNVKEFGGIITWEYGTVN